MISQVIYPKKDLSNAVNLRSAWKEYNGLIESKFLARQFQHGRLHFCGLCHEGETIDLFQDENVFITIYGACYTRFHSEGDQPAKRLMANELRDHYNSSGLEFVNQIKGSFILILSDNKKQETYFITDPISLRSFYYINTPHRLIFSSSLLSLKKISEDFGLSVEQDGASIIEYYLFDFTLGDQTMLKGVKELQAGMILKISDDGFDLNNYADPLRLFPLTETPLSEKRSDTLLTAVLKKNIELFSDGPEETALALTGGYDSRSIAAQTGSDFKRYQYYSYGKSESWDIKIPKMLARKNNLDYQFIDLNGSFKQDLSNYAQKAIRLGDGIAEANRANYVYVYSNFLKEKKSILSGLLGSELIKTPSSRGLFIDENILSILRSENPEQKFEELYDEMLNEQIFTPGFAETHRNEVRQRVLNNRFINNNFSINKKLFYFVLMVGSRKYFSKEVKLERFFLENRTPFFDVDFIRALLLTPFPWVYNYSKEKNLMKNLKIHRVYANFIRQNKRLMGAISTHGFKPKYLLSKIFYPLLIIQYTRKKKQISRDSKLNFDQELKTYFSQKIHVTAAVLPLKEEKLKNMETENLKNYIKLNSLGSWMKFILKKVPA